MKLRKVIKKGKKKISNAAGVTAGAIVLVPMTVAYAVSPKFRKKLDDEFTG